MNEETQTATGEDELPKVRIKTNFGPIVVRLRPDRAPKTVENFLRYVDEQFYDGTIFHRVIDGFMIQGGGFERGLYEKATHSNVKNEAGPDGLKNTCFTVAMARTPDPHSASAQFFINIADNDFLDFKSADEEGWGYCVFGEVVEGAETAKTIGAVEVENRMGMGDVPVNEVVIESVSREEAAGEDESPAETDAA